MPLSGPAAMLLLFDVAEEAIPEHDEWHTREHLPERLAIPGFLRGSRWVAPRGTPRYFVMYEVQALATLESTAYLQRLDNPSPWTSRMMPHYRGMRRGFCNVSRSMGAGLGRAALLVRFTPEHRGDASLRVWLFEDALPAIASRKGFGSAHLFESALTPGMTNEQRIRGGDAGLDWVVLVTSHSEEALERMAQDDLRSARFTERGASGLSAVIYRMEYMLTDRELAN